MASRQQDPWDRRAEEFDRKPLSTSVKWGIGIIGVCFVLAVVIGLVSWIGSWGGEAARIVGPQNTKDQTTAILGDWQAMKQAAGNACDAKNSGGSGSPTLVEDPAFAYKATYRRVAADYTRRMNNLFEGAITPRLPHTLSGYPREAPTLKEMQAQVC